jgi:hypothetical protein
MSLADPPVPGGDRSEGRDIRTGVFTAALIFVIVIASFGVGLIPSPGASHPTSSSVSSASAALALCSKLTPAQEQANAMVRNGPAFGTPSYDEQLLMGFEQNFTSSVTYNVTIRALNDSFGFGPAYLLNGLTDQGYWYQVGVAWNLATGSGAQYNDGFRFVYEVWNGNTGSTIFPRTGGTIAARFAAEDGNLVELSLNLTQGGLVSMRAHDWNTSAKSAASYYSFGASEFLAYKDKVSGFPTSLLTEWYHALPYACSDKPVVYSNVSLTLSSAWMRIDEWNLTGVSPSQRFNSNDAGQCCIFSTGFQGVGFQNPGFRSLSTNGTTIFADAHEFITP